MHSRSSPTEADERERRRVRLARLEADVAYFQARLEMIGEPHTANQSAQRKAFKLLYQATSHKVARIKACDRPTTTTEATSRSPKADR